MVSVTVLTGPLAGRRFDVSGELTIGREAAGLTVPDQEVSRHHAAIRVPPGGGVELRDLGSLNGTWVDGIRIADAVLLGDGARFSVGTTTFAVSAPTGPGAEATAGAAFVPAPTPRSHRPRGVATRLWLPAVLSFLVILATAVALLAYFALR
ncbi:MAG TPA: FHA domain-containing protein [Solirubrobacteraceae bacterium]|nr:FHA domain-containing protein [Solirubrobacteraceae bacterium]